MHDQASILKTNISLYWIVCAVSLGGLLFGFDAGVISGCDQAVQKEFALAPFWHGLVMAGALIGTVFGALAAGKMSTTSPFTLNLFLVKFMSFRSY